MIIRVAERRRFTVIDNAAIEDVRLSWRALGVLTYLLSRPDNWEANYRHLASLRGEGQHAVRKILKELEDVGYIDRRRESGEGGRFQWVQVIYESPCRDSPRVEDRSAVSHPMENQRAVTGVQTKTEQPLLDLRSTEEESPSTYVDEARRLCDLLANLIETNGSRRPVVSTRWVTDMERILRIDERPADKVETAIRWCQSDEFWRANILSPSKLRAKYEQLRLTAKRANGNGHRRPSTPIQDHLQRVESGMFNDAGMLQ